MKEVSALSAVNTLNMKRLSKRFYLPPWRIHLENKKAEYIRELRSLFQKLMTMTYEEECYFCDYVGPCTEEEVIDYAEEQSHIMVCPLCKIREKTNPDRPIEINLDRVMY